MLPLFTHASPGATVAWHHGAAVSAAQFLADVAALRERLPPGRHLLNVCGDRYRFAVGLGAALTSERISLLPPTYTPVVIDELRRFAPDSFCLTDDPECAVDLPQVQFDALPSHAAAPVFDVPQIPATRTAAFVFTSGSTGTPIAHRKTWERLVRCVQAGARRLEVAGRGCAILATVPAQHMYGFESSLLLALQAGNAFCAERPFHPAEVVATLAALPRPRALVTTPVHLRLLLAAGVPLPAVDLLVSATAPLSQELARESEAAFHAPLQEIYGSTETGQIATRRTASETDWLLWPGVTLQVDANGVMAQGGHIEQPMPLHDVIEITGADRFRLHGRTADMVNIAGKRSSLGYLNHHLNAIPGVLDGAFVMRSGDADVERLAALVVAPTLTAPDVLHALRERIDAVFLPRPLLLLDRLPRNATGKLPRAEVDALIAARTRSVS